jgi:ABC-type polar amino acid transport system ATPase subunit
MLRAESLSKKYGSHTVVDDASLELREGSITALIGPSGSGKSTLVRMLALIEEPNSGIIELDEQRHVFPSRRLKSQLRPWPKVTVVFQQHFLWPHLSLRKNILLPCRRPHFQELRRLVGLVKRFEMRECLERFPNQVSMGQRQRAALIRALMLKPKYLLMDEITSALDVEQAGQILKFFIETWDKTFATLIVTHHLGFARNVLRTSPDSRIAFMSDGRIIEQGGCDILDQPTTTRLKAFVEAGKNLE